MAEDVIMLFEEYAARVSRGEEPDARDYLDRAGAGEPKLAALIEEYLLTMPVLEPTDEQVAALEAWLEGEGPLLGVRRHRGLKRADVVGRLVELLGLEARRAEKVGEYYHELESGLLDTARVDRRVFDALGQILAVPVEGVLGWRPRPRPEAAGAYFRVPRGEVAEAGAQPQLLRPAPSERDEVDRLFLGDR
jgi:hypothetical protein